MMEKLKSLTIFFPAYNDAKSIGKLVRSAYEVAPKIAGEYEVMVVNDGSTDPTGRVLDVCKIKNPSLRIIQHKENLGYGSALRTGFKNATKDFVFYTDGDGQYDPKELESLVAVMSPSIDVVNGFKLKRSDRIIRKIIGGLYNYISHVEYLLPISDVQCDFRLMRRSILKKLVLISTSGLICLELVVKLQEAGARFTEIGVHHYPRLYGRSQFFKPLNIYRTVCEHIDLLLRHRHLVEKLSP